MPEIPILGLLLGFGVFLAVASVVAMDIHAAFQNRRLLPRGNAHTIRLHSLPGIGVPVGSVPRRRPPR